MINEELEKQLAEANLRADRWREKCRALCSGMLPVFNAMQQEIEPQRPIINLAGFYRCCVEALRKIETAEPGREFECPICKGKARLNGNVWGQA